MRVLFFPLIERIGTFFELKLGEWKLIMTKSSIIYVYTENRLVWSWNQLKTKKKHQQYINAYFYFIFFHSKSMDWWEWAVFIVRSYSYQNKEYQSWITILLLSWPTIYRMVSIGWAKVYTIVAFIKCIIYFLSVENSYKSIFQHYTQFSDSNVVCMCGFMPPFISSYNT